MLKSDVLALIAQGEGAKLEFERDEARRPEQFAKEIVAFANMNGGTILIGVEDDGRVSGIRRGNLQEWLMDTVIGRHVLPFLLPDCEKVGIEGKRVAVVKIFQGNSKPYVFKHNDREDVYVRYGNTCRLVGREQQTRMFASGSGLAADKFPVHGSSMEELDRRRYVEYFEKVLHDSSISDWRRMLINRNFLVGEDEPHTCSYFAYALFAGQPGLRLPQAGVRLTVYPGEEKDYDSILDETLDAPFLEFRGENPSGEATEPALHDRLIALIEPHISKEGLQGAVRKRTWDYPYGAVRELIINAFTHRDWTKNNYVRITAYSNRLEITSPGGLPSGMTVEKIKSGAQVLRNPNCTRIFREYGYLEERGRSIRRKVIPAMKEHNNTEPVFEATDDYFKVVLWK